MTTGLFGQTVIEPMRSRQIPLFHEPVDVPAPVSAPIRASASAVDPANTTPIPFALRRGSGQADPVADAARSMAKFHRNARWKNQVCRQVEEELKRLDIHYIAVNEMNQAIFPNAELRPFHFVAYAPEGMDNWLILCGDDRHGREDMAEWQAIFGDGFKSVIAYDREPNGIAFCDLDDERLNLSDLRK